MPNAYLTPRVLHDRPSVAARGDRAGRSYVRGVRWPRGDRAHGANYPEAVSCMNFKALIQTKLMKLELNRLHYAKEGTSNYHKEQKHSTDL